VRNSRTGSLSYSLLILRALNTSVFTSWISHALYRLNGTAPLEFDTYIRTTPQLQSAFAPDLSGEEDEDDDHY